MSRKSKNSENVRCAIYARSPCEEQSAAPVSLAIEEQLGICRASHRNGTGGAAMTSPLPMDLHLVTRSAAEH